MKLPYFGIEISVGCDGCTLLTSALKDGSEGPRLTAAFDAIESLVLAHASAGVDVCSPAYCEGVETAVNACQNTFDGECD